MTGPATWLSEAPATGTVASDGLQAVVVTFDANMVNKPALQGLGHGQQQRPGEPGHRRPDDDGGHGPGELGVLQGTINSLGHCDANPAPLGGAVVTVTGSNGMTRNVTTGADGAYLFWLPDYAARTRSWPPSRTTWTHLQVASW